MKFSAEHTDRICFAMICVLVTMLSGSTTVIYAQVRLTQEEALRVYFPEAQVEHRTVFLTDEQVHAIQSTARAKVPSKILSYYVARKNGHLVGTAFFETQVIRTMPAAYIVVIAPDTTIRAVEILAFHEPPDYAPPERWKQQFMGKSIRDDLFLKRGIQNIAGATLSAQALTDGVRRVLVSYATAVAAEVTR